MSTPSRRLVLSGNTNFRDLGGYAGHAGRTVRWRKLFRSDHLGGLTPDDLAALSGLGLARVCDFRGAQERQEQACAIPGVAVHALSIEPTVVQGMQSLLAAGKALTAQSTVELMEQTYRDFVLDNTPRFAELFGHLLDNDTPLVFHCTAGKDRTGFAAALILSALGVPRAVVMQDYLLTNDYYRQPAGVSGFASQEVLDVLWRVRAGFLEASLQTLHERYGGVDAYLGKALALGSAERARLHALYLDQGGLDRVVTYYRRAIELEPGYAEPYSGLALAYCLDIQNHWADTPDALGVAAHFAAQAIDKGPDEPYAQYAAAVVLTWRRDLAGALAAADRALALNPNYALAGHLARLPFQNAAGLDRIRDGLAKAGLSG